MGHSHTHDTGNSEPSAATIGARQRANLLLAAILVPACILTIIGMILL